MPFRGNIKQVTKYYVIAEMVVDTMKEQDLHQKRILEIVINLN